MRKLRTWAVISGIIWGCTFLFCFIGETYEFRATALPLRMYDFALLFAGPFTLILATLLGLRHERVAGYWLITGGLITATLFAVRNLLQALLVFAIPMLIAGWFWLKRPGTLHRSPSRIQL